MHILMVTQVLFPDTIGGAGRYVRDAARGLLARGHAVSILAARVGRMPEEEVSDGIRVFRYGRLSQPSDLPKSFSAIRALFRRINSAKPVDVIAAHQPLAALPLLGLLQAGRIPWVYHFHSPWDEEYRLHHPLASRLPWGWIRTAWMRRAERRLVRHADAVVVLSRWMGECAIRKHGIAPKKVQILGGCVDLSRFSPASDRASIRRALGLPQEGRLLLTVRNLVRRMNLDSLIDAMPQLCRRHPGLRLVIAGDGPLRKALKRRIAARNLQDSVLLAGKITDEALPDWYRAADVFIMPSRALEGFGLASLEALASGTPVVGTPVGGTRELLEQADASWLSRDTSAESLAEAAGSLLQRLDSLQAQQTVSLLSRKTAERFSLQQLAQNLENAYRQVAAVRILHVHTLPVISGSGLNTLISMKAQQQAGCAVALACAPGGPLLAQVEQSGMAVHRLKHMVWAIHPLKDFLAVLELYRLMRANGYTIVHTHNSKAGFIGRLAARLAGVPVVVHTVHGFAFHEREPAWKRALYRSLERLAAGWCDKLVMISQPLMDWAAREAIGRPGQAVKIYSGIDLSAFHKPADGATLRASFGLAADDLIVGEVAKLWEGKGHDVLLKAASALAGRFPKLRVVLIGEGGLRPSLNALAQRLGIAERVVFTGFREDIPALTRMLDIAVLPSLFEGMGRAVIEAQAAGRPVVASRVGGIPDLIEDGRTGLLVAPGDPQALAEALGRLCADSALRRMLGEQAQQAADARFDAQTMNKQILQVYDELLAAKGCRSRKS